MAEDVARRNPADARRLFDAMSEPFAVYTYEEQRLLAANQLAALVGEAAMLQTLSAMEPNVPWNEAFLTQRLAVYQRAGDSLAARAKDDLETYRRNARAEAGQASSVVTAAR